MVGVAGETPGDKVKKVSAELTAETTRVQKGKRTGQPIREEMK
jgi:hypothetical protein